MRAQVTSRAGAPLLAGALSLTAVTPAAADPPTPSAATPRVTAAPTVVTRALMREVAASQRKLAALVDRDAGVVFIDHFAGGAGEPQPIVERLLCGRALDRKLRLVRGWLDAALHGDPAFAGVRCSNRPGPPTCQFGGTMEWDPVIHLQFRPDPTRGLVLRAITIDDEVLVDPSRIAAEHRTQARLIARLGAHPCSP